jgi:hypothetical protein
MAAPTVSQLDFEQVLPHVMEESSLSLRVKSIGNSLVPEQYDDIKLTYVAAGNGVGEIQTVTYFYQAALVATLTLTYDAQNRLTDVQRS